MDFISQLVGYIFRNVVRQGRDCLNHLSGSSCRERSFSLHSMTLRPLPLETNVIVHRLSSINPELFILRQYAYFTQRRRTGHKHDRRRQQRSRHTRLFHTRVAYRDSIKRPTINITYNCGPSGSLLDREYTRFGLSLTPKLTWTTPYPIQVKQSFTPSDRSLVPFSQRTC